MVTWQRNFQSLSHSPAVWSGAACSAWPHTTICKLGKKVWEGSATETMQTYPSSAHRREQTWGLICKAMCGIYSSHLCYHCSYSQCFTIFTSTPHYITTVHYYAFHLWLDAQQFFVVSVLLPWQKNVILIERMVDVKQFTALCSGRSQHSA